MRDPMDAGFRWLLSQDLKKVGAEARLSKRPKLDQAAFERAERKRHRDKLLRSIGMDPRPPRRDGRAIQAVQKAKERLAKAVREEDYELATKLRDQLKNSGATP